MNNANVVVIPLDRYEKLVRLETRVNAVVNFIDRNGAMGVEDLLALLDTETSADMANSMHEKRMESLKRYRTVLRPNEREASNGN